MAKTIWRVYVDYGSGYGWVPVNWAPTFDTEEEAREWISRDHGWESPVDVEPEDWEEECECVNCAAEENILPNGYCEECFDQGCDDDDNLH
jgi:hypothetical protein